MPSAMREGAESEFRCNEFKSVRLICIAACSDRLTRFSSPAREASVDFKFDAFLDDLEEFFTEDGDAIETRKFKALKALLRKRQQRLKRRVRTAHGSALPGL